MWQIIDDNGVIHSGEASEMERAFVFMTNPVSELEQIYDETNIGALEEAKRYWNYDWTGDLKLIQIHRIYK